MPPSDPRPFSLPRFLWRAIAWAVLAGVAWKMTLRANADVTIWLAKGLQRLAGFPAPYLFCDEHPLFWHATLFPPVVGLVMASYWLRWRDRVMRTVVGYGTYACLTAIAIIVNESPYLSETRFRASATSALVNANCLMFGLVIWMLSAGPWYARIQTSSPASPPARQPVARRMWTSLRHGWVTRLVLLIIGVSAVVPLFAATGSRAGLQARLEVARAMRRVPFFPQPRTSRPTVSPDAQGRRDLLAMDAIRAIERVIARDAEDGLSSATMFHLNGHLYYGLRPDRDALAQEYYKVGTAYLELAGEQRWR
ncbi:MAG: hypothetical protein HOP29_16780 [Phycisphaerales bacterium]|nr:hypothetical protein [Phycisphaerales bacterium]